MCLSWSRSFSRSLNAFDPRTLLERFVILHTLIYYVMCVSVMRSYTHTRAYRWMSVEFALSVSQCVPVPVPVYRYARIAVLISWCVFGASAHSLTYAPHSHISHSESIASELILFHIFLAAINKLRFPTTTAQLVALELLSSYELYYVFLIHSQLTHFISFRAAVFTSFKLCCVLCVFLFFYYRFISFLLLLLLHVQHFILNI